MAKEPAEMNKGELVAEVRKLRHLMSRHMRGADTLWMESGVSSESGKPFVHMHWGDQSGQLTPEQAREHATHMIETATAADFDAKAMEVLRQMGLPLDVAAGFLVAMREARGEEDVASATRE